MGKTTYQAATQATQLVAENITKSKKICGMLNISKLCPQSNKDFGASNTDHKCVRTIDVTDAIGNEKRWVEECVTQLHDRGLSVNLVTTDPDAPAFKGAENQFRPPIALRTDLSHITTELWEIPVLQMAH